MLLCVLVVGGCATAPAPVVTQPPPPPSEEPKAVGDGIVDRQVLPGPSPIRIAAVGDIMLGTDYPQNRLPEDGGTSLLGPVADVLRSANVAFGNFEGTLLDGGEPSKRCNSRSCYVFRTPTHYADHLRAAGFDVVSLANNHARDFGEEGRSSTIRALENAAIRHSGRFGDVARWTVDGTRVAMIAFSPFGGSWPMLDLEQATAQIRALADSDDIVIVSFHGGAEGDEHIRIPFATEVFHGEDRGDVAAFARAAIDAGADLVLGHGPHVPRALELYRNRLIAYSLGNFCTYWGIKVSGYNGLAPILLADLAADGTFLGGRVVSAVQERPLGPVPDPQHRAARLIKELSNLDFPDSPLQIADDGELRVRAPPERAVAAATAP